MGLIMNTQCMARWARNKNNVMTCWNDGFNVYALVFEYSTIFYMLLLTVSSMWMSPADSPIESMVDSYTIINKPCLQPIYFITIHYLIGTLTIIFDYYYIMNKLLERDLQASIQSLKAAQLTNVLAHFQNITNVLCQKNITKRGMNYQCQVSFRNMVTKGYGRTQEESLTNATKNLLSNLVSKNIDTDKITQSLRFKNGQQSTQSKQYNYKQSKQQSLFLDDISMIQANSRLDFYPQLSNQKNTKEKKTECDCVYYDMHQYQHNEIKHLQARVNLLSQENMLLKKMLLCGSTQRTPLTNITDKQCKDNKQNDSYHSNSLSYENMMKI